MLVKSGLHLQKKIRFFDTKFVSYLVKNYTKFNKLENKESHMFNKLVLDAFSGENLENVEADRFYLPFNFDKTHWVGICVDCTCSTIFILDSDVAIRSDVAIAKELNPIAQLFPYLLKKVGVKGGPRQVKQFMVERVKGLPQNSNHFDSGVTSVLFMQAHAMGGVDACRCITPQVLQIEAERLSVMVYEDKYGCL